MSLGVGVILLVTQRDESKYGCSIDVEHRNLMRMILKAQGYKQKF